MPSDDVPQERRLSQRLDEKQYQALKKHIPDKMRQRIFDVLINGMIDLYESEKGEFVNAAILSKDLTVRDLLDGTKP